MDPGQRRECSAVSEPVEHEHAAHDDLEHLIGHRPTVLPSDAGEAARTRPSLDAQALATLDPETSAGRADRAGSDGFEADRASEREGDALLTRFHPDPSPPDHRLVQPIQGDVRVARVVVECDQAVDSGEFREREDVINARMAPADAGSVFVGGVLRIMDEEIHSGCQVMAGGPAT